MAAVLLFVSIEIRAVIDRAYRAACRLLIFLQLFDAIYSAPKEDTINTSWLSHQEFLASSAALLSGPAFAQRPPQRAVVIMFDRFGLEYIKKNDMPTLSA